MSSSKTYHVLPEGRRPDFWDKVMHLPLLRLLNPFFQKHREALLYLFFGGVTTVISWVTFWLFDEAMVWWGVTFYPTELLANVASWIVTVLVAFLTNRVWVFHAPTKGAAAYIRQLLSFYGSRVATLLLETGILWVFVTKLGYHHAMLIKIAASVLVVIVNYVFSKLFVFTKKKKQHTADPQ